VVLTRGSKPYRSGHLSPRTVSASFKEAKTTTISLYGAKQIPDSDSALKLFESQKLEEKVRSSLQRAVTTMK
jgi:hypothetical protein